MLRLGAGGGVSGGPGAVLTKQQQAELDAKMEEQ